MDYSLAKELKDAGFVWPEMSQLTISRAETFPTLEELVEACGILTDRFCLEQHSNDWRAGVYVGKKQFSVGKNATEAVARLWLALNKKV